MLSNFILCLEAVIPMFIALLVGYLVKLAKIVDKDDLTKFNKVIFYTLFPLLMFTNIYNSDIKASVDLKLIIFALVGVLGVYFAGTFFTLGIEKNHKSRGALIQAIYRSNVVIMGIPIATNIYGHSSIGTTAVIVAIIVPLYNVLAVVTLETYRGSKPDLKKVLLGIIKNPLIIGAALGVIFGLLSIPLPDVIHTTINDMSAAASPVALIILGASFSLTGIREGIRNLSIAVLARLIVVPGIVLCIAALIGIRDIGFITMLSVFAAPCALSSFPMALEMESDAKLAGNSVVITSILSCFTMFGWLLLFRTLGVF